MGKSTQAYIVSEFIKHCLRSYLSGAAVAVYRISRSPSAFVYLSSPAIVTSHRPLVLHPTTALLLYTPCR